MRQHYFFAIGTFSVGAAIGVLTVLSNSPVVAVVIPLLFGLIAGASGFYLAREDISQKGGRERLAFIGTCVTSLCIGLILMGAMTFWAQSSFRPKTLQEQIELDHALSYEEQMLAVETRAIARALGADLREQTEIALTAIAEMRIGSNHSENKEIIKEVESEINEIIAQISDLQPIRDAGDEETDDYVDDFNLALGYARAMLVLSGQSDLEDQIWRQYVENMIGLVESIVGSNRSLDYSYIVRMSNENPSALSIMTQLRSIGVRWRTLTSSENSDRISETRALPQSRADLIMLLQGQNDEIAADPWGYFPTLAENSRFSADRNFDLYGGPS